MDNKTRFNRGQALIFIAFLWLSAQNISYAQSSDTTLSNSNVSCWMDASFHLPSPNIISYSVSNVICVTNDTIPIYADKSRYDSIEVLFIKIVNDSLNTYRKFPEVYKIFRNVKAVVWHEYECRLPCLRSNMPHNWAEIFPNIRYIDGSFQGAVNQKRWEEFSKLKSLEYLRMADGEFDSRNTKQLLRFIDEHPSLKYMWISTVALNPHKYKDFQDFLKKEIKKKGFILRANWEFTRCKFLKWYF